MDEARMALEWVRATRPHFRMEDYFRAFHLSPDDQRLFREAASLLGME